MRRPESFSKYTVEVSPTAWKQMAHLPLETYQRIREELEAIAARLRAETPAPLLRKRERSVETRALLIGEHVAHYEVDSERRRLTLQEISRLSPRVL